MEKATIPEEVSAIIGIGNPGKQYADTYHNVGIMAATYLMNGPLADSPIKQSADKSLALVKGSSLCVGITHTFMNESGPAVKEFLKYSHAEPTQCAIIHDDSDMEIGSYKITFDQRSAGHKGIDSIIAALGTQKFWRIKIGIRPAAEHTRKKAEEFVLKKISRKHLAALEKVFEKIASSMERK